MVMVMVEVGEHSPPTAVVITLHPKEIIFLCLKIVAAQTTKLSFDFRVSGFKDSISDFMNMVEDTCCHQTLWFSFKFILKDVIFFTKKKLFQPKQPGIIWAETIFIF